MGVTTFAVILSLSFVGGVALFTLGVVAASMIGILRLKGAWKLASAIPILLIGYDVFQIIQDPNSHNLWPIEIAYFAFGSSFILGLIILINKKLTTKP